MTPNWTLIEQEALRSFLASRGHLRSALEKYLAAKRDRAREMCAANMASVPRSYELAAVYAAKADVFNTFMAELENAVEKSSAGPTG